MDKPASRGMKGFGLLLFSISLASFMSSLDSNIVNIALPSISESFDLTTTTVSWVTTSYLLVITGCLLVFGRISDTMGYKKVFLSGFFVFTLGSLCCGILPEIAFGFLSLIASRMFQAVGGAMMLAVSPAMVTAYFPGDWKAKAMSIVAVFAALGTAIASPLGGVLSQYLSWHWIFLVNVPIGIVALILGAKVIPASQPPAASGTFDRAGGCLAFAGLASLVFVVSEGPTLGWTSPAILATAILAAVSLLWFVRHERGIADPILDLGLFRNRNFVLANLLLLLVGFSFSGICYLLPFYLEYVHNYSPTTTGLVMTALSVPMVFAGLAAGMTYKRIGPRRLCIIAAIPLILGYVMMTRLAFHTSTGFVALALVLIGLGLGLISTPVSTMVMMLVAKAKAGMVSGLTSLERKVPTPLGIATFNAIFIAGAVLIAKDHDVTRVSPAGLKMETLSAGFDLAFILSVVLGVVILVLAIAMKEEVHPDYAEEAKVLRKDSH